MTKQNEAVDKRETCIVENILCEYKFKLNNTSTLF